jgi:hypothetical protein
LGWALLTLLPLYRPEHTVYKGLEPRTLLINPLVPMLAICVGSGAFRDYTTVDELFSIPPPPEGEVHVLEWNDPDTPFFVTRSGMIQKATSFSDKLRGLGHRAEYIESPTIHDFKAESLHKIGESPSYILQH